MGLFKKKEETKTCSCGGACEGAKKETAADSGSGVKVLGSGCKKCNELEAAAKEALAELGMDDKIDHVTDFSEIAAYGVMSTPALVVDGKVVSYGKVLKKEEAAELIRKARA